MTSSAEKLVLFPELMVASGFIGAIVFLGLVWLARRLRSFRGCLRCGCELQYTGGHCLMCGDPLRRQRSLPRGGGSAPETVREPRSAVESPSYPWRDGSKSISLLMPRKPKSRTTKNGSLPAVPSQQLRSTGRDTRPCARCGGLLVAEVFPESPSSWLWFWGLRCLNCGHIVDPVMRRNRQQPLPSGWSQAGQQSEW